MSAGTPLKCDRLLCGVAGYGSKNFQARSSMIRRNDGQDWLLISQMDHAHLAAEIASVWGNEDVPAIPLPELLVPAIQDHDDGWYEWEQAPTTDPQTGWPRDFTEMQMPDATEIWSTSIDHCARGGSSKRAAVSALLRYLRTLGQELTAQMEIVLDFVLAYETPFHAEDICHRVCDEQQDHFISRSTVYKTLKILREAGVIRQVESSRVTDPRDAYEVSDPVRQPSRLAGIWTSRHFCWLAEKALSSRKENDEDRLALTAFLQRQACLQAEWRQELSDRYDAGRIDTISLSGFRYLQFFDRISLWMCCSAEPDPLMASSGEQQAIRLTEMVSRKVLVEPYPLSVETLRLSVAARRIAASPLRDDAQLLDAIADAPLETIEWILAR